MTEAKVQTEAVRPLHPVRLGSGEQLAVAMVPSPPWPAEMLPRPMKSHRVVVWYTGEDLTAMVYESDDGTVEFTNLPYDEQVTVLSGQARLTSADGQTGLFVAGDTFVAPKGWSGTWDMSGGYRELITFHTASIDNASKMWWPEAGGH